jgi:hypothetical protein
MIHLRNTTIKTSTWTKVRYFSNKRTNYLYLDQVPVVIYELNESAINFISQESFEKALILL